MKEIQNKKRKLYTMPENQFRNFIVMHIVLLYVTLMGLLILTVMLSQ